MKYILLIIFITILNYISCDNDQSDNDKFNNKNEILIIISYDGFRNEYLKRNVTPNMLAFRESGVYSDYMLNVFPTKTFTNHHSIATGFYAEKHGILANSLYDQDQGALSYSYELFHYDPNIIPIWIVNQLNGGASGCMMWPGSNFEYANQKCSYLQVFNTSIPLNERVDIMFTWLLNSENPPNLIMFYSEQPDKLAHIVGPDSNNITNMVKELDLLTKYIQDKLIETNLINRTNVVHLSDHGMASVTKSKFINLTDYLEEGTYKMFGSSPVLQIIPVNVTIKEIYDKLLNGSRTNGNFKIYTNDDILPRWHAKNLRRLGPILAVANDGYAFQDMYTAAKYYETNFNVQFNENSTYGIHGYDNEYELMHAYFMAKGPSFKPQTKIKPFNSVDLFSLFLKLLTIDEELKRDGRFAQAIDILQIKDAKSLDDTIIWLAVVLCAMFVAIGLIFCRVIKRNCNYVSNV